MSPTIRQAVILKEVAVAEQNLDKLIGQRIKAARERHGWTQVELIEKLAAEGCVFPRDPNVMSRIERADRLLKATELSAFARVLDTTMDELASPFEDEAARLRGALVDSLERLLFAVESVTAATGDLAEANVRVELAELLQAEGFDLDIKLRQAHPVTQRRFNRVASDLLRTGSVTTRQKLKAAERRADAQQVADLKKLVMREAVHDEPLPDHLIPTYDPKTGGQAE